MKSITNFTMHSMRSNLLACGASLAVLFHCWTGTAATSGTREFSTPQAAVTALKGALSARNLSALREIFGPGITNLINPDRVQATNEFAAVSEGMNESNRLVTAGAKRMFVEYGSEANSFPVPLVEKGGRWSFDTEAGIEEVINRRIGRNELAVLDVVRTYVEAQREYAATDRDSDQVLEYAQKVASTPGVKDGLYWDPDLDGTLSPLGPLVAEGRREGYRKTGNGPQPFHGYYFKILTRQGKSAPGGAYDYIINGNMIGGFAMIAWPAEYDETGIMTFIVNQQGRVYQKDLGPKTDEIAGSTKIYNPDSTWAVSPD